MALSVFDDKSHRPTEAELCTALGKSHAAWTRLIELVTERIDGVTPLWAFASASTGWGLRLRRKGRVLVYVTPRAGSFLVSFALGEKAVAAAHAAKLPASVLKAIDEAPRFPEGRGVRFDVRLVKDVPALVKLVSIKDAH